MVAVLLSGLSGPLPGRGILPAEEARPAAVPGSAVEAPAASAQAEPAPATPPQDEMRPEALDAQLKAADDKVAALAATRLLQAIATKDPAGAAKAARLTAYLLEKLDPSALQKPEADAVVASRIVDAMATWITTSGPPLQGTAKALTDLVGVGPSALRQAVVRALQALARQEIASSRRSPALDTLRASLDRGPPPPEAYIRDASGILWDVDGKALLEALLDGLSRHKSAAPGSDEFAMARVCLEELRSRVPRDFSGVEGWQKWWSENRDLPLDAILSSSWLKSREEGAAIWKQLIRRLRETADAERLLLALQDTLGNVYIPEIRTAAVLALGDFADWVVEMPVAGGQPAERSPEGDPKDKLLLRAVQSLEGLLASKDVYVERPEIVRAALGSLSKYHDFIERNEKLLEEVSAIVAARLPDGSSRKGERSREELLETIRLAGALRVESALKFVESLLESRVSISTPRSEADLELLTVAVTALGRLVEKAGLSEATAGLLLSCFKGTGTGSEKAVRELRRACVTALGVGAESPAVREVLCAFHRELLSSGGEKDLRIPAILALGTLARQKDEKALQALLDVLSRQEEFETHEVIAAVDSIAYVGGDAALSGFLRYGVASKDKRVQSHIQQKTVGLLLEDGVPRLFKAIEDLEQLALVEDLPGYLEFALALWQDPAIQGLVTTAQRNPGGPDRVESIWRATLAYAQVQDLLGLEKETAASLATLAELLMKEPAIKEKCPQGVKELADFKAQLTQRAVIQPVLKKGGANDIAPLLKDLMGLVESGAGVWGRWRNLRWVYRQVAQAAPSERLDRIREAWCQGLSSESSRALWEGFPPQFREKHLSRLAALRAKTQPTP